MKKLLQSKQAIIIILAVIVLIIFIYQNNYAVTESEPNELGGNQIMHTPTGVPYSKNFKLSEFNCKDGTVVPTQFYGNVQLLMNNLQVLRNEIKVPIIINSGYRTPIYNNKIEGAATQSMHLQAAAADFTAIGYSPKQLGAIIEKLIASGRMDQGGLSVYKSFVHYDVRGVKARW